MRVTLLFILACGSAPVAPASPPTVITAAPATPALRPSPALVHQDGEGLRLTSPLPDGEVTLLGEEMRCVGRNEGGHVHGCPLEGQPRVAIAGDTVATLVPAQAIEAPPVDVDAVLRGGFRGHSMRFTIESPAGDALCPGAPTLIRFYEASTVLGETSIEAAIPRQIGRGVSGLIVTNDEVFVLLHWGRNRWRIMSTQGEVLADAPLAPAIEDCDCCE